MKKLKIIITGIIIVISIVGASAWKNHINNRDSNPEFLINKYYNYLVEREYKNNIHMLEGKEFKGNLSDLANT
ncbi:hypothetical protein [Paenibacillus sedimenti]|uniref:Uncharacterized protein n=1 Tax=Paenibacillus sedimenti TaxID=2770274 RepID=A0A926QME1_9BACL|nr:hypothetical protein [Paenibacillus sedimenti]MBD0384881.1 hypothetical protein [Paenibacillus sedimenti]